MINKQFTTLKWIIKIINYFKIILITITKLNYEDILF
jgi:hypothetical protein